MKLKVAIAFVLSLAFAFRASAYNFAIGIGNGDSLFFDIVDHKARLVKVVPPNPDGPDFYAGFVKPSGILVIPSTVSYEDMRYTVVAIGQRAFSGCTKIRMVSMPETLQEIEGYAFYGCIGLKERVIIGKNVRKVGASAFYGCTMLSEVLLRAEDCQFMGGSVSATAFGNCHSLRKIEVEEGVRRIPDFAFCGVDAIKDSLRLPQSLEYIGEYAFAFCNSLPGNIVIPDKVTEIGECAFHQCHRLKTVTIGSAVTRIGGRAFYHCLGLNFVKVNAIIPPEIMTTTFADLDRSVKFSVPCVSSKLYAANDNWGAKAPFRTHGNCSFRLDAEMEDVQAGFVTGGGACALGDTVTLIAVCYSGYGFDGWNDGNRENPRNVVASGDLSLRAVTRQSGIIHDTIYSVDTVYAEGYKVIHDTMDLIEIARPLSDESVVQYDMRRQRVVWKFPKNEKVFSVSLFNSVGECVYQGNGRDGSVYMRRYPSGTYYIRIETMRRVLRNRFFISSNNL